MTTLYLTQPYSTVRKEGETLIVKAPENKETGTPASSTRVPMMKVDQVVVMGDSTVTTPALVALLEQNADICFCDYYGRFKGRLAPSVSKNVFVRAAQFQAHEDYRRRVLLAARFVRGKLHNQRTLLLRSKRSLDDEEKAERVAQAAETIGQMIVEVDRLQVEEEGPPDPRRPQMQSALGALHGMEGAGAAAFFRGYGLLLKHDLGFNGRKRRPPTDPVNALLSFGYTLLMNHVLSAVQIVGFDPYIGYLHSKGYGKPSLALDSDGGDAHACCRLGGADGDQQADHRACIISKSSSASTSSPHRAASAFSSNLNSGSTQRSSTRSSATKQPIAVRWNCKRGCWANI